MQKTFVRRRFILVQLAATAWLTASGISAGWAIHGEPGDDAANSEASKGAGKGADKGADKGGKHAVLIVVVTGNNQALDKAEVIAPFGLPGELKKSTSEKGEVVFQALEPGTIKVRVLAPGWVGVLKPVTLKAGSQQMSINLVPSP
jgi:hypothetical protein